MRKLSLLMVFAMLLTIMPSGLVFANSLEGSTGTIGEANMQQGDVNTADPQEKPLGDVPHEKERTKTEDKEGSESGTNQSEDSIDRNQQKQAEIKAAEAQENIQLELEGRVNQDNNQGVVDAYIRNVAPIGAITKGNFTFTLPDGTQAEVKKYSETSARGTFQNLPAGKHEVTVQFKGTIQFFIWEFPLETSGTVTLSSLGLKLGPHDVHDERAEIRIPAKVVGGEQVRGTWTFTLHNGQQAEKVVIHPDHTATGMFSHLPAGDYTAAVSFKGYVDGQRVELNERYRFSVEKPEPGKEYQLTVNHSFDYNEEKDLASLIVEASIPNAKEASGTWVFTLNNDDEIKYKRNGTKQSHVFNLYALEPGETYQIDVHFDGKVDGETQDLKYPYTFTIPEMHVTLPACSETGLTIDTGLSHAESAEGIWTIIVFPWDDGWWGELASFFLDNEKDEFFLEHESDRAQGLTYSHTFSRKELNGFPPGNYTAVAFFEGDVDGSRFPLIAAEVDFTIDEKAACLLPGDGNGKNPGNKDPGGKTPDDEKKPGDKGTITLDPKEGKKVVDQVKNGAKLPKTATSHPWGILVGGLLAALGTLLFFRKKWTLLKR
ncbi:LPXTG cell wall anchor domain-containing protein [Desmospora profundinema]|uniref:LPXTG-motif cell wall-anchored protein n=1 Tax=Desmospora profundinema TaxID=1571184 RepID=A0ABU1INC8_9BACL|nr:LPXTG cell wall anchor domain-containing protein [Desmospora profundinema]MDR6226294.1 LPXTG-motif cell wall-anchored protein [Desmospora profundinema]